MTGYESKRAAAQAKTIDQVNWADHKPNGITQPAQEPVTWTGVDFDINTTPPQRTWVGLTVEEIEAIGKPYEEKDRSMQAWGLFACAIEAKLKEKNT